MKKEDIAEFLAQNDYDLRKRKDGTWIDQKCTPDVVSFVAECILNYMLDSIDEEVLFTINNIKDQPYSQENIDIFGKPAIELSVNEYDKFFSQPTKLLNYAGIIEVVGRKKTRGRPFLFKIKNQELLEYITNGERQALTFLQLYIEKVLRDSDRFGKFEQFFLNQTVDSFDNMKDDFVSFLQENTKRGSKGGDDKDCYRIFTKVLNPLAITRRTKGAIDGTVSDDIIQLADLLYNRKNFYDEITQKPKNVKRSEYEIPESPDEDSKKRFRYEVTKAKNKVRNFNRKYNNRMPECNPDLTVYFEEIDKNVEEHECREVATQIHHIFPQRDYPEIATYYENLIALSPNQHVRYAHPEGKTAKINRIYQYYLLLCKIERISRDEKGFYIKEKLNEMLDIGFKTSEFTDADYDYQGITDRIIETFLKESEE